MGAHAGNAYAYRAPRCPRRGAPPMREMHMWNGRPYGKCIRVSRTTVPTSGCAASRVRRAMSPCMYVACVVTTRAAAADARKTGMAGRQPHTHTRDLAPRPPPAAVRRSPRPARGHRGTLLLPPPPPPRPLSRWNRRAAGACETHSTSGGRGGRTEHRTRPAAPQASRGVASRWFRRV